MASYLACHTESPLRCLWRCNERPLFPLIAIAEQAPRGAAACHCARRQRVRRVRERQARRARLQPPAPPGAVGRNRLARSPARTAHLRHSVCRSHVRRAHAAQGAPIGLYRRVSNSLSSEALSGNLDTPMQLHWGISTLSSLSLWLQPGILNSGRVINQEFNNYIVCKISWHYLYPYELLVCVCAWTCRVFNIKTQGFQYKSSLVVTVL